MALKILPVVKVLVWLTWILPALVLVILPISELLNSGPMAMVFSFCMIFIGYIISFLLLFPYWMGLALILLVEYRLRSGLAWKYWVTLGADMFIIGVFILLQFTCNLDYHCYGDAPLINGSGVLNWFFLSLLFGTLPFVFLFQPTKDVASSENPEKK